MPPALTHVNGDPSARERFAGVIFLPAASGLIEVTSYRLIFLHSGRRAQSTSRGLPWLFYLYAAQAIQVGSPTHPSYPSGHATQNGAFATVLKVSVGWWMYVIWCCT